MDESEVISDSENTSNSDQGPIGRGRSRISFSAYEISLFVNLVEAKKTVIENKRSDFMTQGKKQQAWVSLTNDFNSSSDVRKRTMKQLQKKWDNVKTTAKKDVITCSYSAFIN